MAKKFWGLQSFLVFDKINLQSLPEAKTNELLENAAFCEEQKLSNRFQFLESKWTLSLKKILVLGRNPTNEISWSRNLVVFVALCVGVRSKVPYVLIGSKTYVLGWGGIL